MDSSIWSDTINMGLLIVHIKGLHIRLTNKICFKLRSLQIFILSSIADPDSRDLYPVINSFLV